MVGQFGNDPAVIRTTFSCSLFYWSRTIAVRPGQRGRDKGDRPLHPFRAGRAHLDCVQLYTNAAFGSNLNSTPAVGSRNSNGDDCTKQRGRSHEEVDQDSFSGSRRHHQFAECPLREVVILKLWGSQTVWSL